jgi:hypothetical protein
MNWPKLKTRLGRTAVVVGLAGGMLGGFGAAAAQAAVGSDPGHVSLSPASGPTSGTPTWATDEACHTGFQGSAVFRIVEPSGGTFSISGGVASVTAPFSGTLQDPISVIQQVAGVPNGGTAELVVYCFSGASLTGTSDPEMSTFITFSADGSSYSTSGTQQVPVGEIGGLVFAGLAAIGLVWMQFRRRARRAQAAA